MNIDDDNWGSGDWSDDDWNDDSDYKNKNNLPPSPLDNLFSLPSPPPTLIPPPQPQLASVPQTQTVSVPIFQPIDKTQNFNLNLTELGTCVVEILEYLSIGDLLNLSECSKEWKKIASDDWIWNRKYRKLKWGITPKMAQIHKGLSIHQISFQSKFRSFGTKFQWKRIFMEKLRGEIKSMLGFVKKKESTFTGWSCNDSRGKSSQASFLTFLKTLDCTILDVRTQKHLNQNNSRRTFYDYIKEQLKLFHHLKNFIQDSKVQILESKKYEIKGIYESIALTDPPQNNSTSFDLFYYIK